MKDKSVTYIAIAIAVVVAVLIAVFVWDEAGKITDTTTDTTTTTTVEPRKAVADTDTGDRLDAGLKSEFINSCVDSAGTNSGYCTCAFNYMDVRLTNDEFIQMAIDIYADPSVTPDIMLDAVVSCL